MKNHSWKRIIGTALSVFVLFVGSAGLTGCEVEGEGEGLEQEED